jgi:membrane protease YdiL (CAAX protease family)
MWLFRALKEFVDFKALQVKYFGEPIFFKVVFFILLPMLIIKLRHERLGLYGISFNNLPYHLKISAKAILPATLVFAPGQVLGLSYMDWNGALVLSLTHIVALVIIARLLKHDRTQQEEMETGRQILFFFLIFSGFAMLSAVTLPLGKQVGGFTFGLFASGFGEEILFRGYIQSRLNHVFGKPFSFFDVRWGHGVIIASALFGLLHYLHGSGTIWWGLWTFFGGLVLGYLREKTGSITAPAIVHGLPQAVIYIIMGGI